jgi:hypothetical protein
MSNFKAWAKDVALRAVKTAAQAAVALVTANTAGLTHLNFAVVADVAAMAAFVCVLQNLSNLKIPDPAVAVPVITTTSPTTGYVMPGYVPTGNSNAATAAIAKVASDPTSPAANS